jgi:membrane protease subunit HflC
LGKFEDKKFEPGLYWNIPFYHKVHKYDKRILSYDAPEQRYTTKDQEPLVVDYYVKWRIADVKQFYKKNLGLESKAIDNFYQIVNKGLLDSFAKRDVWSIITEDRTDIMQDITSQADKKSREFGVKIVDVRIKRIELPEATFQEIFKRMESERIAEANEIRSVGEGKGNQIRAEARREYNVGLADAEKRAKEIMGNGDAKAAEIYAKAYNKNPEFFAFYRSLQAYRVSFGKGNQTLVLEPDSDFFKYFNQQKPK